MAKKSRKKTASGVEARLSALEEQVDALRKLVSDVPLPFDGSGAPDGTGESGEPQKFWAIEHINRHQPEAGGVVFAGYVTLPSEETYAWQIESKTNDVLAADWSTAQVPLAALAHPVRLSILKAILHGKRDTQSLQTLPEMGTTGQLYHHLKELESAGWIRQPRRGEYNLLAERVVPLLAILAACEVTSKKPK